MKRATNRTPKQLHGAETRSQPEPEPVPTKIYAFYSVYALCETKRQTVLVKKGTGCLLAWLTEAEHGSDCFWMGKHALHVARSRQSFDRRRGTVECKSIVPLNRLQLHQVLAAGKHLCSLLICIPSQSHQLTEISPDQVWQTLQG